MVWGLENELLAIMSPGSQFAAKTTGYNPANFLTKGLKSQREESKHSYDILPTGFQPFDEAIWYIKEAFDMLQWSVSLDPVSDNAHYLGLENAKQ